MILKLNNEYFIQIWLLNLIIENALKFNYMFDSYCMWCIKIEVIFSINFLFCTIFYILQKHYNLAFNKNFFSSKLSQSLFIFSHSETIRLFQNNNCKNVCYFKIIKFLNKKTLKMYIVYKQQNFINHVIFIYFIIIITNFFNQIEKTFSNHSYFI